MEQVYAKNTDDKNNNNKHNTDTDNDTVNINRPEVETGDRSIEFSFFPFTRESRFETKETRLASTRDSYFLSSFLFFLFVYRVVVAVLVGRVPKDGSFSFLCFFLLFFMIKIGSTAIVVFLLYERFFCFVLCTGTVSSDRTYALAPQDTQ